MNKKSAGKGAVQKAKGQAPRRGKAKAKKSKVNSRVSKFSTMPGQVSGHMEQFHRVLSTDRGRTTVHMNTALCAVVSALSTTAGMRWFDGTGGVCAQLNPSVIRSKTEAGTTFTSEDALSPVPDLESSAYTRYRVLKNVWHYRENASTAVAGQWVFAFAADPAHPIVASTTTLEPTADQLLGLMDSFPFAAWENWDLDVTPTLETIRSSEWLYVSPQDGSATARSADDRLGFYSSIGLVGTSNASAPLPVGVLYWELVMELAEMDPVTVTRPALLGRNWRRGQSERCHQFYQKELKLDLARLFCGIRSLERDRSSVEAIDELVVMLETLVSWTQNLRISAEEARAKSSPAPESEREDDWSWLKLLGPEEVRNLLQTRDSLAIARRLIEKRSDFST